MLAVTFSQVRPPSRVSWTWPSSVPTQMTPALSGDSEMARMVQWFSAPVLSTVRPPDSLSLAGSLVVRSELTFVQDEPRSVDLNRKLPPK
jgi:hypothetical protein